jgi:hypothetical protein
MNHKGTKDSKVAQSSERLFVFLLCVLCAFVVNSFYGNIEERGRAAAAAAGLRNDVYFDAVSQPPVAGVARNRQQMLL